MNWSHGEIQALAIKATRGAGFPWGLAEEAGFAVRWLETAGLPGCASLAAYLETASANHFAACPLQSGTRLLDQKRVHPVELGHISQPLLLVPFLSAYAESPCQLQLRDISSAGKETLTVHIAQKKYRIDSSSNELVIATAACATAFSANAEWHTRQIDRVPESRATAVNLLSHWASKTYAPATEASRLGGAGAGLSDND